MERILFALKSNVYVYKVHPIRGTPRLQLKKKKKDYSYNYLNYLLLKKKKTATIYCIPPPIFFTCW